jgi:hypothetical protein
MKTVKSFEGVVVRPDRPTKFTPKLKRVKIVYCLSCGVNPVDSLGGYDICPDCVGKL